MINKINYGPGLVHVLYLETKPNHLWKTKTKPNSLCGLKRLKPKYLGKGKPNCLGKA